MVNILHRLGISLKMIFAIAEHSDNHKRKCYPECEYKQEDKHDNRHPHKALTLALDDKVLLTTLFDQIPKEMEEVIHMLSKGFLLAGLLVCSLCLYHLCRMLLRGC